MLKEVSINEGIGDVKLTKWPILIDGQREHDLNVVEINNRKKSFGMVNMIGMRESLSNQTTFFMTKIPSGLYLRVETQKQIEILE